VSSLAAGAASYVVKPFTRAVLTEQLQKIIPS
jgi:DNA-binding response OmpR family regulator